jgi:pimeloyl-ACP methyl ester carboxylesterase
VIVIGHSRYGKAALWAGATDPRFAMVVSNDSGNGGAALYRRDFGETIRVMNDYWFDPRFKTFALRENELPVDSNELIALIAPRPVYVASATEDLWSDPKGEFLAASAAGAVYRLYGLKGLQTGRMPAPDTSIGNSIGYHIRTGVHEITPEDWIFYIDFANRTLPKR